MRSAKWFGLCGLVVTGGLASFVAAAPEDGRGGSYVLYRGVQRVELRDSEEVALVERPVVAPAAVIDRALAEQPVHPYLAEVRLISQTTYIDPDANYRTGVGRIDGDHWIIKAQQSHRAMHRPGVLVIRGREAQAVQDRSGAGNGPHMIMVKPGVRPRQDDGDAMPSVPEPPSKPNKQVAMAEVSAE